MHPLTLFEWVLERADDDAVVLAVVVAIEGSVPRRPGAMQAIARDGAHVGTVGGGTLESRVLDAARARLDDGDGATRVEIDLFGSPEERRDGICGGRVEIELLRIAGREAVALRDLVSRVGEGEPCRLARDGDGRLRVDAVGPATGPAFERDGDAWSYRIEPRPLLLVIGGGHCGEALAAAARPLEFDVIVEDDRPEIRARVEAATGVPTAPGPTERTLERAHAAGRELHAALVTRSFEQDVAALRALRALDPSPASIGVMGSRRRLGTVFGLLRSEGWTADEIERLDAPIGAEIGAETPAEIAVSILAGLVRRRST